MANQVGRPALVSMDQVVAAVAGGAFTIRQIAAAISAASVAAGGGEVALANATNAVKRAVAAGLVRDSGATVRGDGRGRPSFVYELVDADEAVTVEE